LHAARIHIRQSGLPHLRGELSGNGQRFFQRYWASRNAFREIGARSQFEDERALFESVYGG